MRRIPILRGATVGACVFAGLFALSVLGGSATSYFGQTDQAWTDLVVSKYGLAIAGFQGWILLLHMALGMTLGVAVAVSRQSLFGRSSAAGDALGTLGIHGLVLTWGVHRRPAAYAQWLWEQDGIGAWLQRVVTDVMPGWLTAGLLLAAAIVLLWGLRPAPKTAMAIGLTLAGLIAYDWVGPLPSAAPTLDRPHLIIIGVDSLRADRLGPDGPAPNITAQAQSGETWERAIVPLARTFPSWVSLLTGKLPPEHGVRHMFPSPETLAALPKALPARLKDAGWRTAVVGDYAGDIFSRWDAGFEVCAVPGFDLGTIVRMRGLGIHHHLLPYLDHRFGRQMFEDLRALADFTDPEDVVDRALSTFVELASGG